jgi:hypothetical protein
MAAEIACNHDSPDNTDTVWEARINDKPFTFRKTRQRGGAFLYSCERTGEPKSITCFFSERDLKPEELEAMPQFIAFVSATM